MWQFLCIFVGILTDQHLIFGNTGNPAETKGAPSGFELPQGWMALIIILCVITFLTGVVLVVLKRERLKKAICRRQLDGRNAGEDEAANDG